MRVTNITIGRLVNLGNYEHVRYEIAVEVKEGESAAEAVRGLENIFDALAMKRPGYVPTLSGLKHQEEILRQMRDEMSEDEVAAHYGKAKVIVVANAEKELRRKREVCAAFDGMQLRARNQLDALHGAVNFADHKRDWEDEGQWD